MARPKLNATEDQSTATNSGEAEDGAASSLVLPRLEMSLFGPAGGPRSLSRVAKPGRDPRKA